MLLSLRPQRQVVDVEEEIKHVAQMEKENHPVSFKAFLMPSVTV